MGDLQYSLGFLKYLCLYLERYFKRRDDPILLLTLMPARLERWWVLPGCWSAVLILTQGLKWSLSTDPLGRRMMRFFLDGTVRGPRTPGVWPWGSQQSLFLWADSFHPRLA